jgi:hypothetical protein
MSNWMKAVVDCKNDEVVGTHVPEIGGFEA